MNISGSSAGAATSAVDGADGPAPSSSATFGLQSNSAQGGDTTVPARYHIDPAAGQPEACQAGPDCRFGGDDFHYPDTHDASVAWKARQLERGIVAYRSVMQATERAEEQDALDKLAAKTKRTSRKMSIGVVRSIVMKNATKYLVNFMGVFIAWAVASGKWLTDDWVRRLLPVVATVVLVALLAWFTMKAYKGTRKAAGAVKNHRSTT